MKAREQETFGEGTPGLYYLRACCGACPERSRRDPTIGRFLTRDPLPGSTLSPQSLNPYPYVQNNPVNRIDPTGMLTEATSLDLNDLLQDIMEGLEPGLCLNKLLQVSLGLVIWSVAFAFVLDSPWFALTLAISGAALIGPNFQSYVADCIDLGGSGGT